MVRIRLEPPPNHSCFDTKHGLLFLHLYTDKASKYKAIATKASTMAQEIAYAASFGWMGIVPVQPFFFLSGELFLQKSNFFPKNPPYCGRLLQSSTIAQLSSTIENSAQLLVDKVESE